MQKENIKELLLEDYRYRAEALKSSEAAGETRLNIFVGMVTLVSGGLVALSTSDAKIDTPVLFFMIITALLVLAVIGVFTLLRLILRNKHTDQCKKNLDHIRETFKDHFDEEHLLKHYYPVKRPSMNSVKIEKGLSGERGFGGLLHLMMAINTMVVSAFVFFTVLMLSATGWLVLPNTLFVFLLASFLSLIVAMAVFIGQRAFAEKAAFLHKKELKLYEISHAGGVVYRLEAGEPQYLLMTSKANDTEWVFPKGHIETHEGHKEAALREVEEETGVFAKIVGFIEEIAFEKVKKTQSNSTDVEAKEWARAKFYLMQALNDVDETKEGRKLSWLPYDKALEELSYPQSKRLLAIAHDRLKAKP